MATNKKQMTVYLDETLVDKIEEYRIKSNLRSNAQAMEMLIQQGLQPGKTQEYFTSNVDYGTQLNEISQRLEALEQTDNTSSVASIQQQQTAHDADVISDILAKLSTLQNHVDNLQQSNVSICAALKDHHAAIKNGATEEQVKALAIFVVEKYRELRNYVYALEDNESDLADETTTANTSTEDAVSNDIADIEGTNTPPTENDALAGSPIESFSEDDNNQPETEANGEIKQAKSTLPHPAPQAKQENLIADDENSITKAELAQMLGKSEKQINNAMNNYFYDKKKGGSLEKLADWVAKQNPDVTYRYFRDGKFYPQSL